MKKKNIELFYNIDLLLTLQPAYLKQGRQVKEVDLGFIEKAAILVENGKINWIGPQKKIPRGLANQYRINEIDLKHSTVLPSFKECHTHLIFAGSRADEFELRNQGVSYQEIAKKGGGIVSTMRKTRTAKAIDLLTSAQKRVDQYVAQGVTHIEVKSGYALDYKNEIKTLEVAKKLKKAKIISTFLGAHALPPEFTSHSEYVNFLVEKVLPVIKKKKLSDRVDIFVEKGFFEKKIAQDYLYKAKELGFAICIHADQLSLSGGSDLAVDLGALSADHVIQLQSKEIQNIASSDVTCVLLPAADLYMKCAYPKARELIDAGARVALATDFNPGSCPTQDLNLVGLLARLEMKMTLAEVITAYTVGASYALNIHQQSSCLQPGMSADFICITDEWSDLFYSVGKKNVAKVYLSGSELL